MQVLEEQKTPENGKTDDNGLLNSLLTSEAYT